VARSADAAGPGRFAVIGGTSPDSGHPPCAKVRAVVVSWNGVHLLPKCLDSLLAQTISADIEVVVVDNASEDGTAEMLSEHYPEVTVVANDINLGFAGGADLGLAGFEGPFIALLNNDATFAVDAIEAMVSVMGEPGNERVGAVTAKIVLAGRYRIDHGLTQATAPSGSFLRGDGWLVPADPSTPGAIRVVNSTGNVDARWDRSRPRLAALGGPGVAGCRGVRLTPRRRIRAGLTNVRVNLQGEGLWAARTFSRYGKVVPNRATTPGPRRASASAAINASSPISPSSAVTRDEALG